MSPLVALGSQGSPDAAVQAPTQVLFEQVWPLPQTFPQAPQLFGSLVVSTQTPEQAVIPIPRGQQVTPSAAIEASNWSWHIVPWSTDSPVTDKIGTAPKIEQAPTPGLVKPPSICSSSIVPE
jgi:hypothetical protein